RVYHEIFADRLYDESGLLASRSIPGAVIHDTKLATERALAMLEAGAIFTASGQRLSTPLRTICVHGDTPQSVEMARGVRRLLESRGVTLAPFAPFASS